MNNWYYLVKGKAQGPVTENQIREMIRDHQLTLNDIIFREGDSKWRRVSEFTDVNFAREAVGETNLQQLIKLPKKNDSGKWVVLLKIQTETEIKFVQKGSWSTEEVKEAIQRGEVSYSDHIWKSGFNKWERIGDLDDFSFKGETQVFSISASAAGKIKLSDEDLTRKPEVTSTATKAALRENPVPAEEKTELKSPAIEDDITPVIEEKISVAEESSAPEDFTEKTRMGFSLKLDKSRLSDLINKVTQEADQAKTKPTSSVKIESSAKLSASFLKPKNMESEKTVIDFQDEKKEARPAPQTTAKIPSAKAAIPEQPAKIAMKPAESALVFDDDEENRKEPSIWRATRTGHTRSQAMTSKTKTQARSKKKKHVWNTIFQLTQVILLLVIVGLAIATVQNIQKKRQKAAEQQAARDIAKEVSVTKPKKRKISSLEPEPPVAAPVPQAAPKKEEVKKEPELAPVPEVEDVAAPEMAPEPEPLAEIEQAELSSKAPPAAPIKPRTSTPFVKIKPVELNSKSPKIRLVSNANEGELIKVKVNGVTGELLERPSFRIEKSLPRRRGKEPEVSLFAWGLSPGYYTIEAEMAGAKAILEHVFVGIKRGFDAKVKEYRKEISYRQQWEKKSLLRISTDMAALAKELFEKYNSTDSPKEWQDFFADWRRRYRDADSGEMRSINSRNQNEFAYPQLWFDLRSLRQKIVSEADELNTAFISSRRTASSPNRSLLVEAGEMVNRVGDLSGWRQKSSK